jgi:hypothetical protein
VDVEKYTLDSDYIEGISTRLGVVVVLDAGHGKHAVLGTLDEYNPRQVKNWLEQLTRDIGFQVTIVGTDYLSSPSQFTVEGGDSHV